MIQRTVVHIISTCMLVFLLGACDDGPTEEAGERIDQIVENQRQKIEEAEQQITESKEEIKALRQELSQAKEARQKAEDELAKVQQERQQALEKMEDIRLNQPNGGPGEAEQEN